MALSLAEFEAGLSDYGREIAGRSPEIQKREAAFPLLAAKFAASQPPHFTREDLEAIMDWKHTDTRWRNRALDGLQSVGDDLLLTLTTKIGRVELSKLASEFEGKIYGVGVASVSAILTAARPDLFAVIDDFALKGMWLHCHEGWLRSMSRDKKTGRFNPNYRDYTSFVKFCRERAEELTTEAPEPWTPRMVEMAFWAIGKRLAGGGNEGGACSMA
jgi:hypothetical protein